MEKYITVTVPGDVEEFPAWLREIVDSEEIGYSCWERVERGTLWGFMVPRKRLQAVITKLRQATEAAVWVASPVFHADGPFTTSRDFRPAYRGTRRVFRAALTAVSDHAATCHGWDLHYGDRDAFLDGWRRRLTRGGYEMLNRRTNGSFAARRGDRGVIVSVGWL